MELESVNQKKLGIWYLLVLFQKLFLAGFTDSRGVLARQRWYGKLENKSPHGMCGLLKVKLWCLFTNNFEVDFCCLAIAKVNRGFVGA